MTKSSKATSRTKAKKALSPTATLDSVFSSFQFFKSKETNKKYATVTENTKVYDTQQSKDMNDFKEVLIKFNEEKYGPLFEPYGEDGNFLLLYIVSDKYVGDKSKKIRILNDCLVDFHVQRSVILKREPWQPSTTNVWLRRFLAHLKSYSINVAIKDFDFSGGLTGVLKSLYLERHDKDGSYGAGNSKKILPTNNSVHSIFEVRLSICPQELKLFMLTLTIPFLQSFLSKQKRGLRVLSIP